MAHLQVRQIAYISMDALVVPAADLVVVCKQTHRHEAGRQGHSSDDHLPRSRRAELAMSVK